MSVLTVPLGDVAHLVRGITFKPDDLREVGSPDSAVCLRTRNVQAEVDLDDLLAVSPEFVKRDEQWLEPGDILISSANSWNLVGKCCWIPRLPWPASFGGFVTVLRPKTHAVDRRYLFHWARSGRTQQLLRSFGRRTTNISNLSLDRCREMALPLPPVEAQRRIAAVLDEAELLQSNRRESLAKLDNLTQANFVDMFGPELQVQYEWPVKRLADVVREGTTVTYGIVQAGQEYPGGVPYIRSCDLVAGRVRVSELRRTDPATANSFPRSQIRTGEIVMSIRATVGPTAMVPDELDGANLARAIARISPSPEVDGPYLLEYLRSDAIQRWIERQVKGATFREITLKRLRELPVLVPPLDLQSAFAERYWQAERLRSTLEASLARFGQLFESLQQRAFRGEL